MPYRVDIRDADDATIERLIELGALDVDRPDADTVAALLPDHTTPEQVRQALQRDTIITSAAVGRDANSVWILRPRAIRIGRIRITPADMGSEPGDLKLIDANAFGTGLHPTTALCLELLEGILEHTTPHAVVDVGTGSGVLALAALILGVPRALGLDVDADAVRVAQENARVNALADRLQLLHASAEDATGAWPLVVANVLAAPLIEMATALTRRIAHRGDLILSGIPAGVEEDVRQAYRRLGMHHVGTRTREGWVALHLRASW